MGQVGQRRDAVTPTIWGRWQTRVATLGTLGLLVTAIFAAAYQDRNFYLVLGYVVLFGLGWDILYIALQQLRWDRDWPAAFQVGNGIFEGVVVFLLIEFAGLPGIEAGIVPLEQFTAHYSLVWLTTFLWTQGPMRVLFPRWRFFGGRIV